MLGYFGFCKHKWVTYNRQRTVCIHTGILMWTTIYQQCEHCGKERRKKFYD